VRRDPFRIRVRSICSKKIRIAEDVLRSVEAHGEVDYAATPLRLSSYNSLIGFVLLSFLAGLL
jgi:hypothetical protein